MWLETVQLNEHIQYLDNGLLDAAGVGSTYVVRGDEIAIVETGTSRCAPHVLAGLQRLGIRPDAVRHIVLTHIHMDHAGGTGSLLAAMPEAQVYIHSRTAKYLIEPADLVASAERALGPIFALHGTVEPVPAERIVYADELQLDLGRGVILRAIATPGHSPDHLAYYEVNSRCLFTGDGLGISMPVIGYAGPVTPPPALNVSAQRETFAKLLALDVQTLLFSHYGPAAQPPRAHIALLQERFEQLVALVEGQWQAGQIDHAAIVKAMLGPHDLSPEYVSIMVGWINMSINGLVLALERAARPR